MNSSNSLYHTTSLSIYQQGSITHSTVACGIKFLISDGLHERNAAAKIICHHKTLQDVTDTTNEKHITIPVREGNNNIDKHSHICSNCDSSWHMCL